MRQIPTYLLPLALLFALGGMTASAEPVTLDLEPFTRGSGVETNSIFELTLEQLEQDGTATVLSEEDDKEEAAYTASASLAKGPGGFVATLKVQDERAGEGKTMYVVLPEEDDEGAANALTRSIARVIQAYEAERAAEESGDEAPDAGPDEPAGAEPGEAPPAGEESVEAAE